ncbi:MAG: 16S rRNA (cytosine(967)-C(5))-methyltransferase RsmB, partial [Gammaproteobacteria bacterium]|nr:16S rRNA (cytosine(967)-C(5))-methyltransferase RsmB [Gammaproteobacteria bacterium]
MSDSRSGARLRATAAEIVAAVVGDGRSLERTLKEREATVAAGDRALLRLLCYETLRYHWRLQYWIDALVDRPLRRRDNCVNALLAIGLHQLSNTRIPDHAVVSQTVDAVRFLRRPKLAPLVNAVLRRALRDRIFAQQPSNKEAIYNHPQWFIDALEADWPDCWADILAANNERAPMCLRVNPAHGSAADYQRRLGTEGIAAELVAAAPQAVCLGEPRAVEDLPGFAAGHASVQDAGAQLAAPWLLDGVSGRVLDACAAPGGKSGHLLELGGDRIDLTCIDNDEARLGGVAANLERLRLNATLVLADAAKPAAWWDGAPFDGILLDAPCSASGVIRRHPDIKL